MPVSPADLGELSKVLSSLLTTADVETRAAAVRGVVALGKRCEKDAIHYMNILLDTEQFPVNLLANEKTSIH